MSTIIMAEQKRQNIVGVVEQYGKRLFNFIRGRVKTDADAEDILQEVWYQFSRVVNTEPIEQISGWLFRVARNRITDNYRKQKPLSLGSLEYEDEDDGINFNEILLAETTSPEMEDLKRVFWEELFKALDELPEKQRQVFIWNELEDQTFQEIADRTDENIKTLISRKGYAVKHLRERMQNLYDEFLNY